MAASSRTASPAATTTRRCLIRLAMYSALEVARAMVACVSAFSITAIAVAACALRYSILPVRSGAAFQLGGELQLLFERRQIDEQTLDGLIAFILVLPQSLA